LLEEKRAETMARQAMAATLLPGRAPGAHPDGFHLWLPLPEPWRSETFTAEARRRGVAVTAAETFVLGPAPPPRAVRVCLGAPRTREELETGLRTLADLRVGGPEATAPVV
ncbi:MAG TPA: PLP-dependent aminotransferase family protein, partial [Vicinamibacteria bacterium]